MVATIVGTVAATLAIMAAAAHAIGWLRARRVTLDVRVDFATGPPTQPGGDNRGLATVTVRSGGRRAVVLTELGITRCELEHGKPVSRTARANVFRNGERLEPDDVREATFTIADLPADFNGTDLALWATRALAPTTRCAPRASRWRSWICARDRPRRASASSRNSAAAGPSNLREGGPSVRRTPRR